MYSLARSWEDTAQLTMVLQLLLPKGMNEVTLKIIGCVLEEGGVASFLANLRVSFADRVQPFLFWRLSD
jgi:hypothetical protein